MTCFCTFFFFNNTVRFCVLEEELATTRSRTSFQWDYRRYLRQILRMSVRFCGACREYTIPLNLSLALLYVECPHQLLLRAAPSISQSRANASALRDYAHRPQVTIQEIPWCYSPCTVKKIVNTGNIFCVLPKKCVFCILRKILKSLGEFKIAISGK